MKDNDKAILWVDVQNLDEILNNFSHLMEFTLILNVMPIKI